MSPLRSILTLATSIALFSLSTTAAYASLAFNKSFDYLTIGPGSITTMSYVIVNGDPVSVRNLDFTDVLPSGITIAVPANSSNSCVGGLLSAPEGSDIITFTGGGISRSSSCSISVDVVATTPGSYVSESGDLTSDAGNSGVASATLTVAIDRPGFSKQFSPAAVIYGNRSTLSYTIDNSLNSAKMVSLRFSDTLPTGIQIASPANVTTTCVGGIVSAALGGQSISYTPVSFLDGAVNAGTSCNVSVDVIGAGIGLNESTSGSLSALSMSNYATLTSGKAGATLHVDQVSLALQKNYLANPVSPGDTVELLYTIRNIVRDQTIENISFSDHLAMMMGGMSAITLPLEPCGVGSTFTGSGLLTLNGGTLAAGASCSFSVTLQVPTDASGSYSNQTSEISGVKSGTLVTGNSATAILYIANTPQLTQTFIDNPVGSGDVVDVEYTIVNNSNSSGMTDVAFSVLFDATLPSASQLPVNDFCGVGSIAGFVVDGYNLPQLNISNVSIAAGASCSFTVSLNVADYAPAGTYSYSSTEVTATIDGASVSGSTTEDSLIVVAAPYLTKEFIDDPALPGGVVTLRYTLTHGADEVIVADANDVSFSDDFTTLFAGLSAINLPLNDVCGLGSQISGTTVVTLSGGSLAANSSCSFDVSLQLPSDAFPGAYSSSSSELAAAVGGVATKGAPGSDELLVSGLSFSKAYIDDPVVAGGTVTLEFSLENTSTNLGVTDITFTDNLRDAITGMAAINLPLADVCGLGSSLIAASSNQFLIFSGGNLLPGERCTFSATLEVPVGTPSDIYGNSTSSLSASFNGAGQTLPGANDSLEVSSDLLGLTMSFTDDPVIPGANVNLEFVLSNLSNTYTVTDIQFNNDLAATLPGLSSTSGTVSDICGTGSSLGGTDFITFSGGSLAAGASCSFNVTLSVPAAVDLSAPIVSTTDEVTGQVGGLSVMGGYASDEMQIHSLTFSKAFSADANAGGSVLLSYVINNLNIANSVSNLGFIDNFSDVVPGVSMVGAAQAGICGDNSSLTGGSLIFLSNASLTPGGTCSFTLELQIPVDSAAGSYVSSSSYLSQAGSMVAEPATDTLIIIADLDADNDGVEDSVDNCPNTAIPELTSYFRLGVNRFALIDGDTLFDTRKSKKHGNNSNIQSSNISTTDTRGCSCEQIIEEMGLGQGHKKRGCSRGVIKNWIENRDDDDSGDDGDDDDSDDNSEDDNSEDDDSEDD